MPLFQSNILPPYSGLKMKTVYFSEMWCSRFLVVLQIHYFTLQRNYQIYRGSACIWIRNILPRYHIAQIKATDSIDIHQLYLKLNVASGTQTPLKRVGRGRHVMLTSLSPHDHLYVRHYHPPVDRKVSHTFKTPWLMGVW
jgi:hypothetical protein